jgi:hypothetical protein
VVEGEWILKDSLKLSLLAIPGQCGGWRVGGPLQGVLVAFIPPTPSSGPIGLLYLKIMAVVLLLVVVVGCWRGAIVCERFGLMSEGIRDVGGGPSSSSTRIILACIKADNM